MPAPRPVPPDEYPVHRTARSTRHVATGDRDAHDCPLAGAGYPAAPDWQHGRWKGRGRLGRRAYDLTDPAVMAPAAYGVTGHAARFAWDGRVGYGIFEHGGFGRHTPSGFTGQEAM